MGSESHPDGNRLGLSTGYGSWNLNLEEREFRHHVDAAKMNENFQGRQGTAFGAVDRAGSGGIPSAPVGLCALAGECRGRVAGRTDTKDFRGQV